MEDFNGYIYLAFVVVRLNHRIVCTLGESFDNFIAKRQMISLHHLESAVAVIETKIIFKFLCKLDFVKKRAS